MGKRINKNSFGVYSVFRLGSFKSHRKLHIYIYIYIYIAKSCPVLFVPQEL